MLIIVQPKKVPITGNFLNTRRPLDQYPKALDADTPNGLSLE